MCACAAFRSPRSMVNLEVWTGPDDNLAQWWSEHSMNVLEAGPVTAPGRLVEQMCNTACSCKETKQQFINCHQKNCRFAWFVPRSGNSPSDASWKLFLTPGDAEIFSVSRDDYAHFKIDGLTRDDSGFYCSEDFCMNGRYTPNRCQRNSCATLFASYGGN